MKMRTFSIVAVAALLALGAASLQLAFAQEPSTQPQVGAAAPADEPAFIVAEFTQSLNGKKLKPRDQVKAEVSQDVVSHGRVVVPAESKLLGYVTEVKTRGGDTESRLGIVFNKIVLKHHEELGVQGVVHALSPPAARRSLVDEPDPMFLPNPTPSNTGSSGPVTPMGNTSGPSQVSVPRRTATAATSSGSLSGPVIAAVPKGNIPGPVPGTKNSEDAQGRLSVGMPSGVFGLKGLSLTRGSSSSTPGPVILSKAEDVKLDNGTQVLVRVAGIPAH